MREKTLTPMPASRWKFAVTGVAVFLSLATLSTCQGESESAACIPGSTQQCWCGDGSQGAQVCNEQGSGYGTCSCNGAEGDAFSGDAGGRISSTNCQGVECGPDGDGGSCGQCDIGAVCKDGHCLLVGEIPCMSKSDCPVGAYCANWVLEPGADDRCHVGTDGDPCYTDSLCLSELACNDYYYECRSPGVEGEMCDSDNDCELDLYCADFIGGGDDQCHDGSEGDPCDGDYDCLPDLYCAGHVSGDDKCHSGSEGDPCLKTSECKEGLVCNEVSETCEEPCGEGCDCGSDEDCTPGLYCADFLHGDDKCHDGGEGDPCNSDSLCIDGHCSEDAYGDDRCFDGSDGDPCKTNEDCAEALVCNEYFDQCKPPGQDGDWCGYDSDCLEGLYCGDFSAGDNKCHDGSEGAPCHFDSECTGDNAYCADFSGGDDKCHDGSAGDPCHSDSDCQPGLGCNSSDACF